MKLYRLFVLMAALYGNALFAQLNVSLKKVTELKDISSGFRPVFVSSKSIVFTDGANTGLYLSDFKKKTITKLCDDIGAGNHFKVSEDGNTIVYKS
jgi:hypothetical protein